MSSLSMGLNGYGIPIGGNSSNPGVLNNWLRNNAGYICAGGDCNNLVIDAPARLAPDNIHTIGEVQKPDAQTIQDMLSEDIIVIAHVHQNTHFVLLTGYDQGDLENFYVNDPFYSYTSYPYANITDVIMYKIVPQQQQVKKAL